MTEYLVVVTPEGNEDFSLNSVVEAHNPQHACETVLEDLIENDIMDHKDIDQVLSVATSNLNPFDVVAPTEAYSGEYMLEKIG